MVCLAACGSVCPNSNASKPELVQSEETADSRQKVGKRISAGTNTHTRIEELLDAVFSMI
jgi:hypothetical protein